MADEISTPENAAPGAPVEIAAPADAPAAGSAAQSARVADLIAAQRAPKPDGTAPPAPTSAAAKRGPGRPRADGSTPPAAGEKRKKPSGKKPTRAQLAERVKELQAARGGAAPGATGAAPGSGPAAPPSSPSGMDRPEVKARFAAGVARMAQQGGKFLAARRGPHWKVETIEANALGEATADAVMCIEELAPSLGPYIGKAVQLAPLGIFAAVLFGILAERMEKDAEAEARRARGEIVPAGERVAVVEGAQLVVSR